MHRLLQKINGCYFFLSTDKDLKIKIRYDKDNAT